jgi:cytochrome oxidase Cu insertion factor (SCO1/SenC/PrrC family)
MRLRSCLAVGVLLAAVPAVLAQQPKKSGEDFVKEKPAVGDVIPDVTVYTPDGKEFKTSELRGHYTVITFGCLT